MGQGRGKSKGKAIGQAYTVQADYHDPAAGTIIDGMVLISSSWTNILFDTGASHIHIGPIHEHAWVGV